jgi:hypothetical protein
VVDPFIPHRWFPRLTLHPASAPLLYHQEVFLVDKIDVPTLLPVVVV